MIRRIVRDEGSYYRRGDLITKGREKTQKKGEKSEEYGKITEYGV
jgi:hypothetical protein